MKKLLICALAIFANIQPGITYADVMRFLRESSVERNVYDTDSPCVCYSCDLQADAANRGIPAAIVVLVFDGHEGHALVGFDTIDKGMVYIDPQADLPVRVEANQLYESLPCLEAETDCIVWSADHGKITLIGTSWNTDTSLCEMRQCPAFVLR